MATEKAVRTIFDVVDKITPGFGKMQTGVDRFSVAAKAAFRSVVPETSKLGGALSGITKGVLLGNLITKGLSMAAGALKNTVMSIPEFASRADEIGKTAQKLGLTTDALQRYRYAAELSNVASGTLNSAFQVMSKQLGSGALSTSLEKIDAGLARQVKAAKSNDEAFRMITEAANKYTDTNQRTAVLMAAFGKAGNQLVPMLGDLSEQMEAAGRYGNIISPGAIESATKFNDTVSRVKFMVQSFGDTIRGAVVQYIVPLIEKFQEWAAANREMINTKINEYISRFGNFIQNILPHAISFVSTVIKFAPIILTAVAAIKAFSIAKAVYQGVSIAMQAYNAMLAAQKVATAATTVEQTGLNAAMYANPIGLIVAGVVILVGLFIALAMKVGGVKNAFIVLGQTIMKWVLIPTNLVMDAIKYLLTIGARVGTVLQESFKAAGQTIMKWLLTPINLAIDGIKGLLTLVSKLPGKAGGFAKDALEAVGGFQDKMNVALTGSESTVSGNGLGALLDPARNAKDTMADKVQAAEGAAMEKVAGIQGFQDKMNLTLTGSTSTLTNSGPGFLLDPYKNAREAELARQKDASEPSGEKENPMEGVEALLREQNEKMDEQTGAINGLADSGPDSPKQLRWGAMGTEDFFEIQRQGI